VSGQLDGLALVLDALEASLTLPSLSPFLEERVFGHLDELTLVLGALETSLTLPVNSAVCKERMFGQLDGLTLVLDAFETPVTLPVISVVDERMFRDLRRLHRRTRHGTNEDDHRHYQGDHANIGLRDPSLSGKWASIGSLVHFVLRQCLHSAISSLAVYTASR